MAHYLAENLAHLSHRHPDFHAQIAQKIGVDAGIVQYWVNGNLDPSLDELIALSDVLGISCDRLMRVPLAKIPELGQIKLLVLDVDGVMTDGGMYFSESGDEIKKFNTKDGRAIMSAKKAGIDVCFLSSGVQHQAIAARAERLGVSTWYVGLRKKTEVLEEWLAERGLSYANVAYIGDDVNDLAILQKAGYSACPSDATQVVRDAVHLILKQAGGKGCVRELVEDYLAVTIG